jgi:hypothetical protein
MTPAIRISGKAVLAMVTGMLAIVSGILANSSRSDLYLLGIPLFWGLALVLGVVARKEIKRAGGALIGKGLAAWGMGIPTVGFGLGFLLLPFV